MHNWDNEIWFALFAMISGGATYITKFLIKKFNKKETELKELRAKNQSLEIHKARMEERLIHKTTKSRGKIRE